MKIQISQPCNENWNNMIPQEKGRFCGSCQKVVVDFTTMTDTEIINHFQNYKGNTCGRFYQTQLNTHLTNKSYQKKTFWSKFITASFALFFFASPSYSNTLPTEKKSPSFFQKQTKSFKKKAKNNDYIKIEGTVTDNLRYSISEATISIKEVKITQLADTNGSFEILIPKEKLKSIPTLTFEITKFGYNTTTLEIDVREDKPQHSYLHFMLNEAVVLEEKGIKKTTIIRMGAAHPITVTEEDHCQTDSTQNVVQGGAFGKVAEVQIIERKNLWQRIKNIFKKR